MSVADELKKYKALLDDGVLTQEEFDAKKKELLGLTESVEPVQAEQKQKKEKKDNKKAKKALKIVGIILLVLAVLAAAFFGIKKAIRISEQNKRFEAVAEAISPVMAEFGLTDYEIKDVIVFNEILCPAFDDLDTYTQMELIKTLNELEPVTDPVDGGELEMDSNKLFVDDSPGYYYYVSEALYRTRKTMRDVMGFEEVNVETPGLYFAGEKILSDG